MARIHTDEPVKTVKLPIIGAIRVGEKVKRESDGKEYPVTLDHFKATGDYAIKFHEVYGEKPTSFGIIFATDDDDEACNERYELRDEKTGSLIGSGDGVKFKIWNPDKPLAGGKGDYDDFLANTPEKKAELAKLSKKLSNSGTWKAILTIRFIIPKAKSVTGLWKLETKGVASSLPNIRDTFDFVRKVAGTVQCVPMDLHVKKVKSQRPGDKRLYPVISLIPNVSQERLEDVRGYLDNGNNMMDIKRLLVEGSPEVKALDEATKNIDVKALPPAKDLFDQK